MGDEVAAEYHRYGEFDHYDHFVHFFSQIEFVYDSKQMNEFCSERFNDLPYKLCLSVIDDDVFENAVFEFNADSDWNEIYDIHLEDGSNKLQKCAYLTTTKVCIDKDLSDYKVSIKAQLANKPN